MGSVDAEVHTVERFPTFCRVDRYRPSNFTWHSDELKSRAYRASLKGFSWWALHHQSQCIASHAVVQVTQKLDSWAVETCSLEWWITLLYLAIQWTSRVHFQMKRSWSDPSPSVKLLSSSFWVWSSCSEASQAVDLPTLCLLAITHTIHKAWSEVENYNESYSAVILTTPMCRCPFTLRTIFMIHDEISSFKRVKLLWEWQSTEVDLNGLETYS